MDNDCDIFERLPDGGVLWRGSVSCKDAVLETLELSRHTKNEVFARDLHSQTTIARSNVSSEEQPSPLKSSNEAKSSKEAA